MNDPKVQEQGRCNARETGVSGRLLSFALFLYLALYLLIPYKPWHYPISFHTPVLGFGLLLMAIQVFTCPGLWKKYLKTDMLLFSLMFLFFMVSALLVHSREFSMDGLRIYLVSFLCFLFVRTAVAGLDLESAFKWINYYLIAAGALILLQINSYRGFVVAGIFGYPCNEGATAGWGFANGPTLGGGILAWLLTVSLVRYLFSVAAKKTHFAGLIHLAAIAFGAAGLFFTFNRSAWLGISCVMLVLVYAYISEGLPKKRLFMLVMVIVASVLLLKVFTHPMIDNRQTKESFFIKFLQKPAATVTADPSANTRATIWRYTLGLINNAPAWGVGVDNFPRLYNKAYPELLAKANGVIDANRNITPHNSYLYYTAELGGIPAFFLFLLVGWVLFKGFRSGYYCDAFPFWAGLLAVCIWAATNDYMRERIFWIVLGVVSGLTHLRPRNTAGKTEGLFKP